MVRSSLVNRRLNTISIFNPFADDAKDLFHRILITIFNWHLDHCNPDSMSGCSTGSARCRSAARWCRAPAPRCHGQTGSAGGPPGTPDQDMDKSLNYTQTDQPVCQMDSYGGGKCSEMSYCGFG